MFVLMMMFGRVDTRMTLQGADISGSGKELGLDQRPILVHDMDLRERVRTHLIVVLVLIGLAVFR